MTNSKYGGVFRRFVYGVLWIVVFVYGLSVPIMVFHVGGVWLDPTGAKWITEHPFGWNYHSREVYLAGLVVVIPRLFFLTVILTVGLVAKNIKLMVACPDVVVRVDC